MTRLQELSIEAKHLLGRVPDIETTEDGKYVVLFMSFMTNPPPKGDSVEDALEKFVTWFKSLPDDMKPAKPEDLG